jgi:spore coat protein U-like protein
MRLVLLPGAILLCLVAFMSSISPARAVGNACSVSGATTASIGNYNPFTGSSFNQVQVTLNLTRYRSGFGYTRRVNFYFVQPAGSPAYALRYQNSSVLYTLPATHSLSLFFPPSGTVFYDFGFSFSPNTVSIPLVVTIPAGVDLNAGDPIVFDIRYICEGASGLQSIGTPTTLAAAVTIRINVLSALQASYVGPALNFGEVGAVTDAVAPTHTVAGAIRVASSGPYLVQMTSTNSYRMTYPGGNLSLDAQTIRYAAQFLGQTKDRAAPAFATVACTRAGISGQQLPLTVALREGGLTKVPSPDYADTLTVTITPLAVPYAGSTVNCPTL